MLKNNRNLVIGVAVVVLLLIVGGVYLLVSKKGNSGQLPVTQQVSVPTLAPSDIGLTLTMEASGQKILMAISKTSDLTSIEYELSYTSTGNIPRGAIGSINVTNPGQPVSQEIVLGTCSDVCHYDTGVSNIKVVVKVTKTDGNVYEVEKSL